MPEILQMNEQEQKYYEENARCILTVWGQKNTQLNDYANRGWGGLTRTFYRERWKRFTEEVIAAMTRHKNLMKRNFIRILHSLSMNGH